MWQIISKFISMVLLMISLFIFAKIILDKESNHSKKHNIISILIFSFLELIIYFNFNGVLKSLIVTTLNAVFCKITFDTTTKKSIFIAFLNMILTIILELLEFILITQIFNISNKFLYDTFAGSILGNITVCVLLVSIGYLLKNYLRKIVNTEISNNMEIVIYSILTLTCILFIFYETFSNLVMNNDSVKSIFVMAIFVIILFSLVLQTIQNQKITKKYDKLLEFMTTYEKEIEKQRVLRHETKNEFLAIRSKIIDKAKNKEIIKYIDEILKDKIEIKQEEYAKFGYLPANGIKGLCYMKTQEAQDKGLITSINISNRVEKSTIYKLDIKEQRNLGKILGVILDNAIEAALKSKEKEFGIESYLNLDNECQVIISNSYKGKIETDKIGKERFSTKGKNRGHGLLLVKHIVDNNDIFQVETNVTPEYYIQTITIKKKRNNKKK